MRAECAHYYRFGLPGESEQDLIDLVAELFGEGGTPSLQEREATAKRLRKLLFGNKQLNPPSAWASTRRRCLAWKPARC